MLYSVRGTLVHQTHHMAVVECAGVGYGCRVSLQTAAKLPPIGKEVMLYTFLSVRQDAVELFGFGDQNELSCFKMLLSVSGVGPKVALGILSELSPERFALSVAAGDVKAIKAAPGVGPKMASRIVLELKDRITKEQLADNYSAQELQDVATIPGGGNVAEAISALVVLGYPQATAARAVSGIAPDTPVEEIIKYALKALSRG